jgi:hypothetical protein
MLKEHYPEYFMETNTNLDWLLGILALGILVAGMVMLLSGIKPLGK